MLAAVWRVIGLFMALAAFLTAGGSALIAGEELLWAVAKAIGAFIVCWIIMTRLGIVLQAVVEKQDSDPAQEPVGREARGD